jgi:Tol biopolymer transport system component
MAADPDRRARFEREARAVAALNHPNIVTLHSVEESDGVHFITMELVEGQNLAQLLPRGGFPLNRLLEIAIPLADAVSRAHRAGITHRDLKPDNVMIDAEGRLRVLDFGLAKLQEPTESAEPANLPTATAMTGEGKIVGTVAYMSPEQAEGKPIDHRSDIFSLGTILYEMATGKRPFQGETSMSTIGAILKDEPSSVTEINPVLPRHAGRILSRCLAKDPDRRYQTALDLRNELEALKAEIDSGANVVQHQETTSTSRRFRIPMLIGSVVVIAIAVVVATQLRNDEKPATEYVARPVTATSAWDADPNWSPDGKFVAFDRMVSGHSDIYVQPIDRGEAFLVAGGPGDQFTPRWTPDGRYLAYASKHEPGTWVYLVPSDGGKSRKLIATNIPTLDFATTPMGDRPWSSDGETLLVSIVSESMQLAVHRVARATREAEQITFPPAGGSDSNATYSFDEKQIIFCRQVGGRTNLMLMPADGGDAEVILEDEPGLGAVAWRPDNRRIVFESEREANEDLYQIDLVTREVRPLTYGTKRDQGISVSHDDRLVYAPFWHDQFLYVVDVETRERTQLTSHALGNRDARFSPDGRTVAYSSNRTGDYEIWLHHLDGGPETRFTDDEGDDRKPEWSPDGRKILFASDREDGTYKLFVANAEGGTEPRLLTDQAVDFSSVYSLSYNPLGRWSPDDELIAYRVAEGHEGTELWTVGPDGVGARKRLDGVTGFDWYQNSRRGLITRRRGTESELVAVDLDSGQEQILFVGPLQMFDVAPDGSAVAFCYGRGHVAMGLAVLRLEAPSDSNGLPRAVGDPEYVVPTEGTWHVHNGGWSPDSKKLVYTHDQDYGDIYELVERR